MRVTVHDHVGGGVRPHQLRRRGAPEFVPVCDDDAHAIDDVLDALGEIGTAGGVGVAVHGPDGGDRREFREDIGRPNITGVQNLRHALQRLEDFGAHEAMRVGDETDNGGAGGHG